MFYLLLFNFTAFATTVIKVSDIGKSIGDKFKGRPFPPVLVRSIYEELRRTYDPRTETFGMPRNMEFTVQADYDGKTFDYKGLVFDPTARTTSIQISALLCSQLPVLGNQHQKSSGFYRHFLKACHQKEPLFKIGPKGMLQAHQMFQVIPPAERYSKMIWNEILRINSLKSFTKEEEKAMEFAFTSDNFDVVVRLLDSPVSLTKGNLLGKGQFGVVNVAHSEYMRKMAVKTISTAKSYLKKVINEILANRAMSDDPHFAKVYLVQMDNPYEIDFAMELLDGMDGTLISRYNKIVDMRILAGVMKQVLEGLQALHSKGWLHNHITPGNIYITKGGEVKILDLGLASRIGEDSKPEELKTKVPIIKQQQVEVKTTASDVWAAGGLAFYISTHPRMPKVLSPQAEAFVNSMISTVPSERATIETLLKHPFLQNAAPAKEVGMGLFGKDMVDEYLKAKELEEIELKSHQRKYKGKAISKEEPIPVVKEENEEEPGGRFGAGKGENAHEAEGTRPDSNNSSGSGYFGWLRKAFSWW